MRILLGLVLVAAGLSGCEHAVGLVGSCSAEMSEVRRLEGGPPDDTNSDRFGADFIERWFYFGPVGRAYTFRWGSSYESCSLTGPEPLGILEPWNSSDLSRLLPYGRSPTAAFHAGTTGGR